MSQIKKRIFIDAGHNPTSSGYNTGCQGNGMYEQDITFEVSRLLADILKNDFETKLSRPTADTILGKDNNSAINARWQMSNEWGADYFISIHVNAGGGTGAETFYYDITAKDFATTIQNTYTAEMELKNRRTELASQFGVLRETKCPAILIELAFIDSPSTNLDIDTLRNKKNKMAQAIATGIYKYFGITQNTPVAPAPDSTVTIDVLGNVVGIRGHITNGETFVRLTELCSSMGLVASWDDTRKLPVVRIPLKGL